MFCGLESGQVSPYGITSSIAASAAATAGAAAAGRQEGGECKHNRQQQSLGQQQQQQLEQESDGTDDVIMLDAPALETGNASKPQTDHNAATAAAGPAAGAAADDDPDNTNRISASAWMMQAVIPCGCRLLLVRHAAGVASAGRGSTAGWSLLLPAGWVMPFWQALTHAGE